MEIASHLPSSKEKDTPACTYNWGVVKGHVVFLLLSFFLLLLLFQDIAGAKLWNTIYYIYHLK